jgi:hypothetical protein
MYAKEVPLSDSPTLVEIATIARVLPGLGALWRAHRAAEEPGAKPWKFALTKKVLRGFGLLEADFQQLVEDRLVEEIAPRPRPKSTAADAAADSPGPALHMLTAAGRFKVQHLLQRVYEDFVDVGYAVSRVRRLQAQRPSWDAATRRLMLGKVFVKVLRKFSPNQEAILGAFEAAGWPPVIGDPLPGVEGLVPIQRLHEAVKRLNQGQKFIHFGTDGRGGVFWRPYDAMEI